jgi:hypothetical protein
MKSGISYRRFLSVWACLLVCALPLSAAILHIGPDPTADYTTIQAAVSAAASGDTVILAPGTYTGRGNCDVSLYGKALTIRSSDPLDPNVVQATIIDCAATLAEPHQAFYVVDCNGAEISGLTIRNGLAPVGAGVLCRNSTLKLAYCRILDNGTLGGVPDGTLSGGPGGGLHCQDCSVSVVGCLFAGNTTGDGAAGKDGPGGAGGDGAAIRCLNSEVTVTACTIRDNVAGAGGDGGQGSGGAGGSGGAIWADAITLVDTTISHNLAGRGGPGVQGGRGGRGGGISAGRATVDRCIIEANGAGAGGTAAGEAKDAAVQGGRGGDGGGVYSDSLEITNSLVAGNRAGRASSPGAKGLFENGDGGGLWCRTGVVRHCTIAGNVVFYRDPDGGSNVDPASGRGAGVFRSVAVPVEDSVVYENTPTPDISPDCNNVVYCDTAAGACPRGSGNLSDAPLFVGSGRWVSTGDPNATVEADDPNAVWTPGDYHLTASSPCIDAGDPNYVPEPNETDLDGHPRRADIAVDMGAYEFQSLVPVYRFWSPVTGKHFYTISESERNKVLVTYPEVWIPEGIAYYAFMRAGEPNLAPVYRFWSDQFGSHFYTISEAERDKVERQYPDVWTFEGTAFYAWPEGRQPQGTQAVYRFWSDQLGGHFYTISEAEKDKTIAQYPDVWTFEGVAWYAYREPPVAGRAEQPEQKEPVTPAPVAYEFTGDADGALYSIQLTAYVDNVEAWIDVPAVSLTPDTGRMDMIVDLGAMTVTLNSCQVQSEEVELAGAIDGGSEAEIPFLLRVRGSFQAVATRGPYGIDPRNLSFPVTGGPGLADEGETFTLTGAVTLEGKKSDLNLRVQTTGFDAAGEATLDTSALPDRLEAQMAGAFHWPREGKEDLLLETTVKGRAVRLCVASIHLETTGTWYGKPLTPTAK